MDISRNWRLRAQRYRLEGGRCGSCSAVSFPPRPVCLECGAEDIEPHRLSGRGTVYSYTVLYQGPESFDGGVPYAVALIDLDEGPRITAMLTDIDPEEVDFGMPVEMVVRVTNTDGERGPINYSYKFRPRLEARSRT